MNNSLSNLKTTVHHVTKVVLLISAMLLSSCKSDEKGDNNKTNTENIEYETISYSPNTDSLGINKRCYINIRLNNNGEYTFSSNITEGDIDIDDLQKYCDDNGMSDIIVNKINKIEIAKTIMAMLLKDELSSKGREKLGLNIFNTINQSETKNILSAGPFDNEDYREYKSEIITNSSYSTNTENTSDSLSSEDQYLLAEIKQHDSTISEEERKKRARQYNRLSTEIFKLTKDEITSISQY